MKRKKVTAPRPFSGSPSRPRTSPIVAFWADGNGDVERMAELVKGIGGRNVEGPLYEEPGYYAVFFEDPAGNRLEICHRITPPR